MGRTLPDGSPMRALPPPWLLDGYSRCRRVMSLPRNLPTNWSGRPTSMPDTSSFEAGIQKGVTVTRNPLNWSGQLGKSISRPNLCHGIRNGGPDDLRDA